MKFPKVKADIELMDKQNEEMLNEFLKVNFYYMEKDGQGKPQKRIVQEAVFEWTPDMTEEKMLEIINKNIEYLQKQIDFQRSKAIEPKEMARNFAEKYKDGF